MKPKYTDNFLESGTPEVEPVAYRAPTLRKIHLAADEVLSSGCKVAGVCDILPIESGGTGAGS